LRVPAGSGSQISRQSAHEGGKVVSPTHRPPLPAQEIFLVLISVVGRVAQSTTDWTARGSNLGGGAIFRTRPDRPWGPPSLLYNGYRVFPGVKRPGHGADHPSCRPVR